MDEQTVKMMARISALEYLVCHLQTKLFRIIGAEPDRIRNANDQCLENLRTITIPGIDPAWSDMLAAELQDAVRSILRGIEETMGMPKRP
jgi:hypothetical protein